MRRRPALVVVLAAMLGAPVVSAVTDNGAALAASTSEDPTWRWPLDRTSSAVRGFDPPAARWHPGHRGVDLLGNPGVAVRAAGAGVIVHAGMVAGRGVVTVRHGALRTTYEPVSPSVQVGARVEAGDIIGILDDVASHCAPRACLHWGLLRGDVYLDPLTLVAPGRPRLLPVWDHRPPYSASVPAGPAGGAGVDGVPAPPGRADAPSAAPRPETPAHDDRDDIPAGGAAGLVLATGVGTGVAALLGQRPG